MNSAARIPSPILRLSSPNKPDHKHCLINVLTQKGWSLEVPIRMTYLDGGADLSNSSPQEVTAIFFLLAGPTH
jgi:hypothetical protein